MADGNATESFRDDLACGRLTLDAEEPAWWLHETRMSPPVENDSTEVAARIKA
jgi:hypothetical protein